MSTEHEPFEEDQEARFEWLRRRSLGGSARQIDAGALLAAGLKARSRKEPGAELLETAPSRWTSIGPENVGGRIRSLAIHPNGKILYAGAATGGVWKSDDGGESWSSLMGDEESWSSLEDHERSLSIGALALHPEAPEVLYAGTGEPYVRLVYPGVGVLKSKDQGDSWEKTAPLPLTRVARILIHPDDPKSVYCAGAEGLFHSPDGGDNWNCLTLGNITDVKLSKARELFIGVYGLGLFKRAENRGWIQVGRGAVKRPRFRPLIDFGRCASCGAEMMFARIDEDILCSCDDGEHWLNLGELGLQHGDPDWASLLIVHPLRPQQVFVGGVSLGFFQIGSENLAAVTLEHSEFKTRDGALDQHVDQHDLAFHPENPDIIYAANDAGVYQSCDGGRIWLKKSRGLTVTQFYDLAVSPHNRDVLGGGTQDRGTWIRRGDKWAKIQHDDGGHLTFDPTDPRTIWCQTQNNAIYRFSDTDTSGPQRWTKGLEHQAGPFIGTLVAIPSKGLPKTILFTGRQQVFRYGVMLGSEIHEDEWQPVSPCLGIEVTALAVAEKAHYRFMIAGTSTGKLWCCRRDAEFAQIEDWEPLPDYGKSLEARPWQREVTRIVIDPFADEEELAFYACYGGLIDGVDSTSDHLFRFRHSGRWLWKNRSGTSGEKESYLPNIATHGLAVDRRKAQILYVCNDAGVFRSLDGGRHWHGFSEGLPNVPCFDIHLYQDPDDPEKGPGILRVATHGRGIYEIHV